jgi:hypothetical protein
LKYKKNLFFQRKSVVKEVSTPLGISRMEIQSDPEYKVFHEALRSRKLLHSLELLGGRPDGGVSGEEN